MGESAGVTVTMYERPGGLNHRNSGGWKSKVEVEVAVALEASLLSLKTAAFSPRPHRAFPAWTPLGSPPLHITSSVLLDYSPTL